ncbi:MAG: hypothetical protein ACPHCJ_05670 [Oceanococcaceae bacterium]
MACTDDPNPALGGEPLPASSDSQAEVLDWDLIECEAILTVLPASAAALAPHLPPGFTPIPFADVVAEMDVPVDPSDGNIGVETFVCQSGQGLNAPVEAMTYGSYYAMITPPEDLRRDVTFHFVKWDVLIPDADRRLFLQERGVPARDGGVSTTVFLQQDSLKMGDQSLTLGETVHFLTANGVVPAATPEGRIAEFMSTEAGLVEWQTDYVFHSVANGAAVVDVGAGDLLAEIVGTGPQVGASFIGALSFVNGEIRLP